MSSPDISVVICTYDRTKLLERTIRSLTQQTLSEERFEILVVHTGEVEETTELLERLCKELDNLRVLVETDDESGGLAHARNVGAGAANGEIIHYIDDDVRADQELLERMYETFVRVTPQPVCVGGRVTADPRGSYPPLYPGSNPGLSVCDHDFGGRYIDFPNETVIGANLAFDRNFLQEVGGFPTNLGRKRGGLLSNEETSLLYTANSQVGVYYQPAASVSHVIPKERLRWGYIVRRFYWQGVSEWRMDGVRQGHSQRNVASQFKYHIAAAVFNLFRILLGFGELNRLTYALYLIEHVAYVSHGSRHLLASLTDS